MTGPEPVPPNSPAQKTSTDSDAEHSERGLRPDIRRLLHLVDGPLIEGPLDVRSLALSGLFVLACLYTIRFAKPFLLPVVLAFLLSFLLWPLVRALKKIGIPEFISSAVILTVLLGGVGYTAYSLSGPASDWIEKAPGSLSRVQKKLRELRKPVQQVSDAAEEMEKLTTLGGASNTKAPAQVELKQTSLKTTLFDGTWDFVAGALVMVVLLYFMLASGDLFLLKLIRVLPRLQDKKRAVHIAREMESHISVYLFSITLINGGLGVSVGFAMYLLEMPNPLLWGVMAAFLNFIPYLGAMVGMTALTFAAFLTFDSVGWSLAVGGIYLALTAIEGSFVTPTILGRRLALNPVVIFIGLIFWAWMWGVVGALLAVPILATLKILCDHIEPLAPIGEFLGS